MVDLSIGTLSFLVRQNYRVSLTDDPSSRNHPTARSGPKPEAMVKEQMDGKERDGAEE